MKSMMLFFVFSIIMVNSLKNSSVGISSSTTNKHVPVKSVSHNAKKDKAGPGVQHSVPKPVRKKNGDMPRLISPELIQEWAKAASEKLFEVEKLVVRREVLLKGFSDVKTVVRNGSAIVEQAASALGDLLERRVKAATAIMRRAEELSQEEIETPEGYTFQYSVNLNHVKPQEEPENKWELPLSCRSLDKMHLNESEHFEAQVSLENTSVHVALEVFDCEPTLVKQLYWSEGLLSTFQHNYAQDATLGFQYMCSAKGFLRHYPAAEWNSMFKLKFDPDMEIADVYDCRLRPWYVSASGAPRDVLILLDASGSMYNSSNKVTAEVFTLALLSALTDDDQVNVLRFNVEVKSPISCFNDMLVPANHVNSAAMMAALKHQKMTNETWMDHVLEASTTLLRRQRLAIDRPTSCQQAIVLLTDSLYLNYTDLMRHLDPENRVRLFVFWLHDPLGLRDDTRRLAEQISCSRDGYFAELVTPNDVTEQVMRILRVMERPLVAQRKERLRVFSDVYAHLEDPRRSEFYWQQKEREEQVYRYKQLRKHRKKLLSSEQMLKDHLHQVSLEKFGHYYEGQDVNYRLQISVSVPVFDYTTFENITIKLDEELQRNSTRTYPVNRLLGVAGVDIPIDHLKLILPYHQVGPGGSLFLLDHRGNVVLHENVRPTFDADILKPGYRTVDLLDVEQPGVRHFARDYPKDWNEFRKELIVDKPNGTVTLLAKTIFEDGMRAILEQREYHWRRVLDHYTMVVALPLINRRFTAPENFTQELAKGALKALSRTAFSIHPDWLYCRHIDPHFTTREAEVLHFIRRRHDEPKFPMKRLYHKFSPIKPSVFDKTYHCDEGLMSKLSREALATEQWADEHENREEGRHCGACELGSVTAFYAGESGLTRWQQYHATSPHADAPDGSSWPRAVDEPWYRRAMVAPSHTLLVHAPVVPVQNRRNTFLTPPPGGVQSQWLTAARVLKHPQKGIVGVTGYHIHPQHMNDVINTIVNATYEDDVNDPEVSCDGEWWTCVLVDEGGWVVGGGEGRYEAGTTRKHLATLYPAAMEALLNNRVFELHWIHDYQAVCFPPLDEPVKAAASMLPSLLKSLLHSVVAAVHVSYNLVTVLMMLASEIGVQVRGDTEAEKEKRRRKLWRDYEREKFDRLYNDHVLVNRTRYAACDRSRPFYIMQRDQAARMLRQPADPCKWPVVGALVPDTNLLLLAVYVNCTEIKRPVLDPLVNQPVEMGGEDLSSAEQLACWRNKVSQPARPPHSTCYPHDYEQEEGYRQCGPWLPDPEPKDKSNNNCPSNVTYYVTLFQLISISVRLIKI